MNRLFLLLLICLISIYSYSQELNCIVQVSSQQIQASDKQVFETLKNEITEFMNNRKWTKNTFTNNERIECSILLNISDWDRSDEFKGSIQIQARRPVYNTSYSTTLINFMDKDLGFKYVEFQPLEFSESSHLNNLTSILAFYAYMIIGMDYDSFSSLGGTEFFQKAEAIVNNAQSEVNYKGWQAFEGTNNRYWMVENILDNTFKPLRECSYKFHRWGLDKMSKQAELARQEITNGLFLLEKVYAQKPGSLLLQMFFTTKSDEIVNIYSEANPQEKAKIVNLLKEIDPSNSSKYNTIMK